MLWCLHDPYLSVTIGSSTAREGQHTWVKSKRLIRWRKYAGSLLIRDKGYCDIIWCFIHSSPLITSHSDIINLPLVVNNYYHWTIWILSQDVSHSNIIFNYSHSNFIPHIWNNKIVVSVTLTPHVWSALERTTNWAHGVQWWQVAGPGVQQCTHVQSAWCTHC